MSAPGTRSRGPDQPAGALYACVNPNGSHAYYQHNVHFVGNSEWHDCWDGPGGRQQWTWNQAGPAGADGADGAPGADGVSGHEVDGYYFTLPPGLPDSTEVHTFTAECSTPGKVATGGGFSVDFPQHRANVRIVGSQPAGLGEIPGDPESSATASAWEIHVINYGPETSIRPWVACALAN